MKKFALFFILPIIFLMSTARAEIVEPSITATSAILLEMSTGRVIYEKNADEVRQPASLTKMMTGILGWENLSPSDEIVISPNAAYTEYSSLRLEPGDRTNALDLLAGTIIVSDNAGAVAVAEKIAGTSYSFAQMMTAKAKEIGCTNTHFANPHGLPNANNLSTARDLAKIAMYGMRIPQFRETVGTKMRMLYWISPAGKSEPCENTNELLYPPAETKDFITAHYDPSEITGIKTGYTQAAGGCLAASAKRGDVELVVIILNASGMYTRFNDAAKLLNYGFDTVKNVYQVKKSRVKKVAFVRGGKSWTVKLGLKEDLVFPLLENEDAKKLTLTHENLPAYINAGITRGDIVGDAILNYEGKPVATVPIIALETVDEGFSLGAVFVKLTEPIFTLAQNLFFEEKMTI